MELKTTHKFFAVGLSEHRLWGLILLPVFLIREEERVFYTPDQTIFPSESDEEYLTLSHTEKEIVKIIDEYNDQHLFKYFSRDKNIKEFHARATEEKIHKFIRPYIEKRIYKVLRIIQNTSIKIYQREKSRSNIYEEDFLRIHPIDLKPVFEFQREEQGSRYRLTLFNESKEVRLKDRYGEVICDMPAVVRLDHTIYFIPEIEGKKINPFFTREYILIPPGTEARYFKSFVKTIISSFDVKASGFDINYPDPKKSVFLSLEFDIGSRPVLILQFRYGDKTIYANSELRVFVDFHKNNNRFIYEKYFRDEEYEQLYEDLLIDLGLVSFDSANFFLKEGRENSPDEQMFDLINWLNDNADELKEAGLKIIQKTGKQEYYAGKKELIFKSRLIEDWFDIYAIIELEDEVIQFPDLRKHILENIREYKLKSGLIFVIPTEWFSRYHDLFKFAKKEKHSLRVHKQHFHILEQAQKGDKKKQFKDLGKLDRKEDLPPAHLPKHLNATLRPYQQEGFTWLWYLQQNRLGGCLADDMGLGKTLQAITLILKNKESNVEEDSKLEPEVPALKPDLFNSPVEKVKNNLIIVPASLVYNWVNEFKRFAPTLKVYSHIGNQRLKDPVEIGKFDVIISSYHTIRQDVEFFSGFHFHYIILDESQVIKNPSSKVYKAMQLLNSDFRLALTGTPIENSLIDLWSQMNFVNNGLLGSLNFFRREYVTPIEKKQDKVKEENLKKLINPFILRRKKDEVAKELPEVSDQVIYCSMTDEQKKFYEEEKSSIRNSIFDQIEKEGIEKSSIVVLQGLTRLRQISNHPRLVDENYREESGKFNELLRNIENVLSENHKVLIFSSFVKNLELIREKLVESEVKYTMLTGQSTKREFIVEAFQQNPDCRVFLISLKAGGVGLNLTAADYVFIVDPWWNPASEEQAINRAHRIGQDKNVFVYRFISESTIEEKIQRLQERKTKLAESFVSSNNPMKSISKKELEELFE